MILPGPRALGLFVAGLLLALLPVLTSTRVWPVWAAFLALALLACGADALLAPGARAVRVEVAAPARLRVGVAERLHVRVSAPRWPVATALEVLADLGPLLAPAPATVLGLPARGANELALGLAPLRRGTARVDALWLRSSGPLRLMRRQWLHALALELPIVPDLGTVQSRALEFLGMRDALSGIKSERFVGDGSEFEALRQFVPGFDTRGIDWKASARHVKLLCRQFRAERNHQVVLALDTGRLMGEPLAGLARLDHAIHHALLLAYVGLRTGDRVGLCSFDAHLGLFVEPRAGVRSFPALEARSAGIAYGEAETNFALALVQLSARLSRRSLIVVFSDFVDSVTAELMLDNLDRLARRHVVLFVSSPDPALGATRRARPDELSGLDRAVVAADLERERSAVFRRLRRNGIHVVDAPDERISARLLGTYLDIRRRELV